MLGIHSAADVRAALYTALPVAATLLTTIAALDQHRAAAWAALAAAVTGPVLAFARTPSFARGRMALYALVGAGQMLAVGFGLTQSHAVAVWMPLVTAVLGILGGGVAVANTDTTPAAGVPVGPRSLDDLVAQAGQQAARDAVDRATQAATDAISTGLGTIGAPPIITDTVHATAETAGDFMDRMFGGRMFGGRG